MLQNLHTHTTYCDGKNSPRELVEAAISKGFDSLGFTPHAPTSMNDETEIQHIDCYINEIKALQKEFAEKIQIFSGIEFDYYSDGFVNPKDFDYSICSVHYNVIEGEKEISYDHSPERTDKHIKEDFSSDGLAYARSYYERISSMQKASDLCFVGHFDLVSKFSELRPDFFDVSSKSYQDSALEALHTLSRKFDFFEVNTGAISRGVRTTPYPAPFILDEMKALGVKLILTSDCHNKDMLDCHFKEARDYVRSHGFCELYYLSDNEFVGEKI